MSGGRTPRDLAQSLAQHAEALAFALLGEPSHRGRSELRFGRKGSVAVCLGGEKRGLFHDHERGAGGDMLTLIQYVNGGTLGDAMRWAERWLGGDVANTPQAHASEAPAATTTENERKENAERIWREAGPIWGTPGETYFSAGRGIVLPRYVTDLRFHPTCPVGAGNTWEKKEPAVVALMRTIGTNRGTGIHRTFLMPDGTGKSPSGKKMLGPFKGSAIKLADDADVTLGLGIAEGVENALTWGAYGFWPVWAAGSADAIGAFPVLDGIEHLTIFADADDSGASARNAQKCARRWTDAGRQVDVHNPPAGEDWNDVARRVAA